MEHRCSNLACVCTVAALGDACAAYCEKPPADPGGDICKCGHAECKREMALEISPPHDD